MWMRKTLEAASARAVVALADEARGMVDDTSAALEATMDRFRDDLDVVSLRLTSALVLLAACVLVAAVVVGRAHE